MEDTVCIRLPYLHVKKFPEDSWDFPLYLWSGIAGEEQCSTYMPTYPIKTEQIAIELAAMRQLAYHDLAGICAAADRRVYAEETAIKDAINGIADALGGKITKNNEIPLLEQAQRMLLWCWLAEERVLEILALEGECSTKDLTLRNIFEEKEFLSYTEVQADLSLLAPWKISTASAAFFLPEDTHIFAQGQMADDLEEYIDFKAASNFAGCGTYPAYIQAAKAPLWQALGHSAASAYSSGFAGQFIRSIYSKQFLWLKRTEI